MSHFTVLVVGDDIEKQLAPYHEFECTGHDDKYVQTIDKLAEYQKEYKEYQKRHEGETDEDVGTFPEWCKDWYGIDSILEGEDPDLTGDHKYSHIVVTEDGLVIAAFQRTNPNAHWDWYQMGGRWTGFFLLKGAHEVKDYDAVALGSPGLMTEAPNLDEGMCDSARKGDIDFSSMRKQAGRKAGNRWTKVHDVIDGRLVKSWDQILEEYGKDKIEDARKAYREQDVLKDLNNSLDKDVRWADMSEPEILTMSCDDFVEQAYQSAVSTFAVVMNGKWYSRGDMGWWGSVSNEQDVNEWYKQFTDLCDSVSDDTLLTVVDCHI